jgi:hypothetical protein
MSESLRSELVGTSGLAAAAVAALLLTVLREPANSDRPARGRAARLLLIGVALQCLHFAEEFATHFHERYPALLGLRAWPPAFFVAFNLVWLVVWALSAFGLRAGFRPAFFPAWFFAIAAVVNGIAHPVLAILARGYFPGLVTSPLLGVAGIALWARLQGLTRPPA